MERPSATADGVLFTLGHIPRFAPPAPPEVLKEWVDHDASLNATGQDPSLAEEGSGEVWVTDENGIPALVAGTVRREEAAEVLGAYTTWLPLRRRWAEGNEPCGRGASCTTNWLESSGG